MARKKKERGRPNRPMPEVHLTPATPEELADIILRAKPKTEWRYLNEMKPDHNDSRQE